MISVLLTLIIAGWTSSLTFTRRGCFTGLGFPPRFEKMGRFSQRASLIHLTLEKLTVRYGYWEENCAKQQTRIAADFQ